MVELSQDELAARQIIANKLGGALFLGERGCIRMWRQQVYPGAKLGNATVIGVPFLVYEPRNDSYWKVGYVVIRCGRCGKSVLTPTKYLKRDKSGVCKCDRHGKTGTRLYSIWRNIKTRCRNKNNRYYENYGARGIDMCDEWYGDFMAFHNWAMANGYGPGLTLDRKSNELGYNPDNCRWVSYKQQANNRRNTVTLTAFSETKALGDWADDPRCVVDRDVLYGRARRQAMTPEEMLTRPMRGEEECS